MLATFIIPTLNRHADLNNCLQSIRNSTHKPDEIILIEQWDLEKTQEIVISFSDLNIILLYSKEKSGSKARNIWIQKAKWKYVFFIDDDVTIETDYIETAVNYLEQNSQVEGLSGKDLQKNIKPNTIWRIIWVLFNIATLKETSVILKSWHNTNIYFSNTEQNIQSMPWCSMVIRKDIFNFFQFPNNFIKWSFGEDVFLTYQIFKKYWNGSLKYLPKLKFNHHQSTASRISKRSLIRMKIIYRYIFWKSEVYDNRFINTLCYIWSQFGLLLLDFFYNFSIYNIREMLQTYSYLIKNYKKIDTGNINYNKYIEN